MLTVSTKEAGLLEEFVGTGRAHALPDVKLVHRSSVPWQERKGMAFVGNFRHLPNGEAVEYLCKDVLPRLDAELLAEHPLTVIGSRLDDKVRAYAKGSDGVRMVGWVPDVTPYLERARAVAAPLLHGAGVKGKLIEALSAGTPVVTTTVGAEGLDLVDGEHAFVADEPDALAAGLERLLVDEDRWQRLAAAGHELVASSHAPDAIQARFLEVVEEVLAQPPRSQPRGRASAGIQRRESAYRETVAAVRRTLPAVLERDQSVLVVTKGDDELIAIEGLSAEHFPRDPSGEWAGHHPADADEAIEHLEELRKEGAGYLAFPASALWWLHRYRLFAAHLDREYRRVYSDEYLVIYDLAGSRAEATAAASSERERVRVLGIHRPDRSEPPAELVSALERSSRFEVSQEWIADSYRGWQSSKLGLGDGEDSSDWTVLISDDVVLPPGFLDEFLDLAQKLLPLGVRRFQPPHDSGPEAGAPVSERHLGVLARGHAAVMPIPLLAIRTGSGIEGPVALLDATPIDLVEASLPETDVDPLDFSDLLDLFVSGPDGPGACREPVSGLADSRHQRARCHTRAP